ncbi:MAG: anhydro-N-acetylmuramic acid kinase [Opitutaceae bacterium]|nr:anhydro-N-acetylmuramic acid kinase [Verrucomicrobiales bacterium]
MNNLSVVGIMSGTSLNGVDYALCSISETGLTLQELWSLDFPVPLRDRLYLAARGQSLSYELAQLHHDLGRFYAAGAKKGLKRNKPDLVGLHGQTVFHNPSLTDSATLQLGEPAYLVEALRVPVVSNFRAADIAAGGQGAPLSTMFHVMAFGQPGRHVCVNNLGGISNVTSIDRRKTSKPQVMAFDTGPADILIDIAMRHFTKGKMEMDVDGQWASKGQASEKLLTKWLEHFYFAKTPPKSTGRELFGVPFFLRALPEMQHAGLSKHDMIATLTELTARSIALNYKLHLRSAPDALVLTGGGAGNSFLRAAIETQVKALNPEVQVSTCAELGWPLQSIEPAAFALLAYLRFHGKPGNLPETTGARRAVLAGQISQP